jgi:hypothetical protein
MLLGGGGGLFDRDPDPELEGSPLPDHRNGPRTGLLLLLDAWGAIGCEASKKGVPKYSASGRRVKEPLRCNGAWAGATAASKAGEPEPDALPDELGASI